MTVRCFPYIIEWCILFYESLITFLICTFLCTSILNRNITYDTYIISKIIIEELSNLISWDFKYLIKIIIREIQVFYRNYIHDRFKELLSFDGEIHILTKLGCMIFCDYWTREVLLEYIFTELWEVVLHTVFETCDP